MAAPRFVNFFGNQSCSPRFMVSPRSEVEVQTAVRAARRVRCVAAGHSVTPLHQTDDTLIAMDGLQGLTRIDPAARRVVARPGTTVGAFGPPLWEAGLALANQGDVDSQGIAGAVATATHGSGLALPSFSAAVRRMRLVTADGEVLELAEGDPRLPAAQVAVGMLGVITELELEVAAAYRMAERIEQWSWEEAWGRYEQLSRAHRHFSFFWLPSEDSAALYGLAAPPGVRLADTCYVKLYDAVGADVPDSPAPGARVGPPYTIYPSVFEPNFHELEYFVPFERGPEAMAAMRELMLRRQPDAVFPMEVRTVAAEDGWLSHSHGRPSTVISVSGVPGTDYDPYLREVDRLLGGFGARVHWGKLHFLTREQLLERYPRAADFISLRRQLDPDGTFLNDHLRPLFS